MVVATPGSSLVSSIDDSKLDPMVMLLVEVLLNRSSSTAPVSSGCLKGPEAAEEMLLLYCGYRPVKKLVADTPIAETPILTRLSVVCLLCGLCTLD